MQRCNFGYPPATIRLLQGRNEIVDRRNVGIFPMRSLLIQKFRISHSTCHISRLSDGTGGERDGREVPQMVAQVDSAAS
jgi:hypothetical protein